jgi:hypothetical protein
MAGAGRDRSIGVAIRLPFESSANSIIAGDAKYVAMKYFFTRKLMLIKESKGFICLPGGFGTLDETFELLTLTQTGKGSLVPIVLLDVPGDPFWESAEAFISTELARRGFISQADTELFLVTDNCIEAANEITRFYANYDSMRYVGDRLVIRLRHRLTDHELDILNDAFAPLCTSGRIEPVAPLPAEVADDDRIDLPRVSFAFARHDFGDLRRLIDALNSFAPAASGTGPAAPAP